MSIETTEANQVIKNLLRDPEHLRMLLRLLINEHGQEVKNKLIGYDQNKEEIALDGKEIKIPLNDLYQATKNLALGLDYDEDTEEILLFTGYTEIDKDGNRYDN